MKYCRVFRYSLSIFLIWASVITVWAQETKPIINASLVGTVVDATTKDPIEGATVQLEAVTHSVKTDRNGRFSFVTGQKLPFKLTVTSVGYATQNLVIEKSPVVIELHRSTEDLDEVVVVGYTTIAKKNLIGAVDRVSQQAVKDIPTGSFDAQLQGKVAGMQVAASTGIPGEALHVRLRGATSINADNNPLYVIDGVFLNSESLQTINTGGKATSPIADLSPSDIEYVEVLKDAEATALYGSRGANGVILITTKRGKNSQSAKIDVNLYSGRGKAAKLWELTTGPEHAELVNEYFRNIGQAEPFRPVADGGRGLPSEQQTYDRLSEAFRTAGVHNADLSVYGGSENTAYYLSAGYNKQESILKPISFDRASFRFNLDQKVNNNLKIGSSNSISRTGRNQARAGDGPRGGLLQTALHTPTYLSPYNDQGVLVGRAGFDNLTLLLDNYDIGSTSLRYIGNVYGEYQISPTLKFRSTFSVDHNNYNEHEYWNNLLIEGSPNGLATSAISQSTTWINEQTLTYRKKLDSRHTIGALLGNTLQGSYFSLTSAEGRGFATNDFTLISAAATTTSNQDWNQYKLASFFGRLDYAFDDKYLLDFSLRADGSSKFNKGYQWGYFPAVGVAWRLSKENFLQDVSFLDDLKLKTSYGLTGNQNGINPFASRQLWSGVGSSYRGVAGIAPEQLANQELSWETTSQFNVGLDAALLNNRLTTSLNYYYKYTKDGLLTVVLPGTTGFSDFTNNAVEISNKGFELSISSVNINSDVFSWNTSLNIARNINNIEKLETPQNYGSRNLIQFKEGHPMYSFWVYNQLYVDPQTGDAVYEDVDGDGRITTDDRQILGSIWPDYFGGISNDFSYKNFDLNTFFTFSVGNKIYNHNRFFGEAGGARDAARIIFKSNLDRWQQPGDITDVPRSDGVNNNNYKDGGGRWLEDGSYLRFRTLSLGYNFTAKSLGKLPLSKLRVYAQATNLFTITKYTGLDPESASSSAANQQGIDLGTPPQPRSFQLGINLTF
ncbi:SusC/RagA family TonB-linked outer membrane protein [Sphingobacterium sp. SGR-19]|uniref:SusC/RagA family TonB-linked outer membrane protein n=1 Tax=Sphingobacterium sp. SGR-19 TaxID=2710886 RepID=UPI0013EC361E|nr:TonB-dependent receptor [Sphingobacterium sp. SGR-19]NGM66244.1 TonB-dependent receptor [Sphingobacterium sp. SGR-19]